MPICLAQHHPTGAASSGGVGCVSQKEQGSEAVKLTGCDLARAVFHLLRGTSACHHTEFTLCTKNIERRHHLLSGFQSSVIGVS